MEPQSPDDLLDFFLGSSPDDVIGCVRAIDWTSASHSSKVIMGIACAAGRLEVVKNLLGKYPLLLNDACSGGFLHNLVKTPMFSPGSGNEIPMALSPVMMASLFGQVGVVEFLVSHPRIRLNESRGHDNWLVQQMAIVHVLSGWRGGPEGAAIAVPLIERLGSRGARFLMGDYGGASALSMTLHALADERSFADDGGRRHPGRVCVVQALLDQVSRVEIRDMVEKDIRTSYELHNALGRLGDAEFPNPLPAGVVFGNGEGISGGRAGVLQLPVWMAGFDSVFQVVVGLMVDAGFPDDFFASWKDTLATVLAQRERHHLQEVLTLDASVTGEIPVQPLIHSRARGRL